MRWLVFAGGVLLAASILLLVGEDRSTIEFESPVHEEDRPAEAVAPRRVPREQIMSRNEVEPVPVSEPIDVAADHPTFLVVVRDPAGAPVAGAEVNVMDRDEESVLASATTDESGGCVVGRPPDAAVVMAVHRSFGRTRPAAAEEHSGNAVVLAFEPVSSLAGVVVDGGGVPVEGVTVAIPRAFRPRGGDGWDTSGPDGRFALRDVIPGHHVLLFGKGSTQREHRLALGNDPVSGLRLVFPGLEISGVVLDEFDAPVLGARVTATSDDASRPPDPTGRKPAVTTGTDGRFSIFVRDRVQELRAVSQSGASRPMRVVHDGGTVEVTLTLRPYVFLSGVVVDLAGDGVAEAGVHVAADDEISEVTRRTDESGRFEIGPLVAARSYDVDVRAGSRSNAVLARVSGVEPGGGELRIEVDPDSPITTFVEGKFDLRSESPRLQLMAQFRRGGVLRRGPAIRIESSQATYRIDGLWPDTEYKIVAFLDGWDCDCGDVVAREGGVEHDVVIQPPVWLTVEVRDPAGHEVDKAVVLVESERAPFFGPTGFDESVQTGRDGKTRPMLTPIGTATVQASLGTLAGSRSIEVRPDTEPTVTVIIR